MAVTGHIQYRTTKLGHSRCETGSAVSYAELQHQNSVILIVQFEGQSRKVM